MKPDAHKSKATRNWKKKNGIVDEKPIVKPKVKEQPNRYDSDEKEYDSEELREMEEELAAEQELLDMAKNREFTSNLKFQDEKLPKIVPFSDKDDEDREMNKSSKFFERPLVVDQSFFEVEAIPEAEPLSPALKVINIQKEISSGPLEPPADKSLPILTKLKASKAENIEEWLDDLI